MINTIFYAITNNEQVYSFFVCDIKKYENDCVVRFDCKLTDESIALNNDNILGCFESYNKKIYAHTSPLDKELVFATKKEATKVAIKYNKEKITKLQNELKNLQLYQNKLKLDL